MELAPIDKGADAELGEELASIAQEIGAEVIRGPVCYSGRERGEE